PNLNCDQQQDTVLLLIDLGRGKNRLGGSILAQVVSQTGDATADVDDPNDLVEFWSVIQELGRDGKILAYHDRSDGGLFATVVEMAFAGNTGVDLELPGVERVAPNALDSQLAQLFSEELGAVVQVRESDLKSVLKTFKTHGLGGCTSRTGTLNDDRVLRIRHDGRVIFDERLSALRAIWSDVTHRIASMRDDPECADEEHALRLDADNPGIRPKVLFAPSASQISNSKSQIAGMAAARSGTARPFVAILREQGVNGHVEMAAAFTRAGFRAIDVHMTDILSGRISLRDFRGLAACGGFSYGDVLGAGEGWAKSILFNDRARTEFAAFFARDDAFALGVCNGCQMMSNLHSIIPGSGHWPRFVQNRSERFEARFASLRIEKSPSVFFAGMEGSVIPIAVAHGEGFAEFADEAALRACDASGLVSARFVDNHHSVTERYPLNPNGSPRGITALTTESGRVTILMPHPERVFRTAAMSWHPDTWGEDSPWMKLFYNAREWVG
ncbi:MAG TPA: phosphoribosylformylglycinamidine synthase subunit PurQ, partial [Gammaproteobacteria bacterium]|nr:phosphoribosylformylglycinamidine synthase subunit PurQ [Gammaproteobacteria bacterium]